MTPTPETDAAILTEPFYVRELPFQVVKADVCEKLERERDEANKELHQKYIEFDDLFDEAEQIRIERDEARQKLAVFQDLLNDLADPLEMIINYWDQDERLESMTAACWHAVGTAEKALQKIKPHLT